MFRSYIIPGSSNYKANFCALGEQRPGFKKALAQWVEEQKADDVYFVGKGDYGIGKKVESLQELLETTKITVTKTENKPKSLLITDQKYEPDDIYANELFCNSGHHLNLVIMTIGYKPLESANIQNLEGILYMPGEKALEWWYGDEFGYKKGIPESPIFELGLTVHGTTVAVFKNEFYTTEPDCWKLVDKFKEKIKSDPKCKVHRENLGKILEFIKENAEKYALFS